MSNVVIISADCHAGAQPETYRDYLPAKFHDAYEEWWKAFEAEMEERKGTVFDQDAQDERDTNKMVLAGGIEGEWNPDTRLRELEADGIAGEVIFPQMAPFGAGLMQYRTPVDPEQNLEGMRAYNRWLADLCNANPGRHAGIALITIEDLDLAVKEVHGAKKMGLWGGIMIPSGTGDNPYYHDPCYEPLWAVCEELDMPVHTHSGWSFDYGDAPAATAMFISEVAWFAHRPFTCFLWAGVFERHPNLKLVMTEQGCTWILETLHMFERQYDMPLFKYFHADLSLRPAEYFQRQCYIGASMLSPEDCALRDKIGIDKLMWGSDYPHLEGTWPHTAEKLQATFGNVPENETRAMLGENALEVFGFDRAVVKEAAEKIGPKLEDIATA